MNSSTYPESFYEKPVGSPPSAERIVSRALRPWRRVIRQYRSLLAFGKDPEIR